jgi:hypothetical protein
MSTHEKCIQFWLGNLQGKNHLQDARLKHTQYDNIIVGSNKSGESVWTGLIWYKRERAVLSFCKHDNVSTHQGRAIAQVVSCWLPTAAARV